MLEAINRFVSTNLFIASIISNNFSSENDVFFLDIYVDPPNDGQNSDSDSGAYDPGRLNRAELQASAKI